MAHRLTAGGITVGPGTDREVEVEAIVVGPGLVGVSVHARGFTVGGRGQEWPDGFTKLPTYPNDLQADWTGQAIDEDSLNGVAHDANNWYFTTAKSLIKVPFAVDLAGDVFEQPGVLRTGIPEAIADLGYTHFGDIDVREGVVWVPLEGAGRVGHFACIDSAALALIAHGNYAETSKFSACGFHPINGLLYCAIQRSDQRRVITAVVPQIDRASGVVRFDEVGELTMRTEGGLPIAQDQTTALQRPQGLAFSARGHMYLALDDTDDLRVLGLHVDVLDAQIGLRFSVPRGPDFANEREFEGITILDLSRVDGIERAPGITGQIHVMEVNHSLLSRDHAIFHHWGVSNELDRGLV